MPKVFHPTEDQKIQMRENREMRSYWAGFCPWCETHPLLLSFGPPTCSYGWTRELHPPCSWTPHPPYQYCPNLDCPRTLHPLLEMLHVQTS